METDYLKTLCTVVDLGSFSRAAKALNITQSAVSQRIRFVENRYGLPLVNRNGSVILPTAAGDLVVEKALRILQLEKELEEKVRSMGLKVSLSLCCTPTFGIVYLPKVLNRFFLTHSDDIDFRSALNTPDQALKSILSHDADVAVIEHCGEIRLAGVQAISLVPDELVFISAPVLDVPGGEVPLELLIRQRLVARRDGCSSRAVLQENLSRWGKGLEDFRGMIIHDDLLLTIQTVLSGKGVAFVSRILVREYVSRGELREHTVAGFHCSRSRTLLVSSRKQDDPFAAAFVACVRTVLPGDQPVEADGVPRGGGGSG